VLGLESRFASRSFSGFIAHLFCGLMGLACHPGDVAFRGPAVASNLDGLPRRLAPASAGSCAASRCLSNAAFFAAAPTLWRSAKLV
jgi:hypothetical protein